MADTFGDLQIPVQPPATGTAIADRALTLFVRYFAAYLNTYAQNAWNVVAPPQTTQTNGAGRVVPVVRRTYTHDPAKVVFNEADLPALFLDRVGGDRYEWMAEDYRISKDKWTLWWVYPTASQETQALRNSFTRAIVQLIDTANESVRDPCYIVEDDPDPEAHNVAAIPDAIKTTTLTSTSDQTYTGAALDGSIGGGTIAPARHITIRVAGDPLSIADGSQVFITGLGGDGRARVATITLTQAGVPGEFVSDWALSRVDSIFVPGQLGVGAMLEWGTVAWDGLGTIVIRMAGIQMIELAKWADRFIVIKMGDKSPERSYDAVEITFSVEEKYTKDISVFGDDNVLQQFAREDGSVYQEAAYT